MTSSTAVARGSGRSILTVTSVRRLGDEVPARALHLLGCGGSAGLAETVTGQAVPSGPTRSEMDFSGSTTAWLKTRTMSWLGLSQRQPPAGVADSSRGPGVSKDQL